MNIPHIKVRNPLISAAPKFKATRRFAYRGGKLVEITDEKKPERTTPHFRVK